MSDAVTRVSVEIAGKEISFETGKLAKQASGAVVVRAGDTMVLCTATAGNLRDVDFLPLTVDVEERMYAAGKIPGSFFKREGRAGEKATLTARLIDRPIRPLFPKGWRYETQLVALPISVDHENPYDMLAMNGASAALMVSHIPFPTPGRRGADRQGRRQLRRQPETRRTSLENTDLDLIVAGTDEAILMVEAGAERDPRGGDPRRARHRPRGDQEDLCGAARAGREGRQAEDRGRDPAGRSRAVRADQGLARRRARRGHPGRGQARAPGRTARRSRSRCSPSTPATPRPRPTPSTAPTAQRAFDKLEKTLIRERIAVHKKRPDGRSSEEIRPISIEVGVAPRTHGSALFTRGQTQALSVVALGTTREEMRLDTLGLETAKRYFHHYNFPPFSVGEAGLHARPQAPRHRSRRARRARAGADDPRARRSSRTRSASSRTSSSPTARPRWRACAARRCR